MDIEKFFECLRPHVNLTTQNVQGLTKILRYGADVANLKRQGLAYVLATAWWETAQQCWPVKEAYWLSEDWRSRNLRYYPYYGRGLIQITWKDNYKKLGERLSLGEDFFVRDPDKALEWKHALPALVDGMVTGLYTGKKLDDYITDTNTDYLNARRIVNGTDRASTVAKLAGYFDKALEAAGYLTVKDGWPVLKMGDTGDAVKSLQAELNKRGFTLVEDGHFGPATERAVEAYQKRYFDPLGIVGSHTWTLLATEESK